MKSIQAIQKHIEALPFASWPIREVNGIASELLEAGTHSYDSLEHLQALLSVQVRLSKAIADAGRNYASNLQSSAGRVVYYATGYTMLDSDSVPVIDRLRLAGDTLEAQRMTQRKQA